jgi:hypothetical protein
MTTLKRWIADPKMWRHFHVTLTFLWALAIIPTLLWWKDSILWVALMSCWANMAAHFSAWQGSRAEDGQTDD